MNKHPICLLVTPVTTDETISIRLYTDNVARILRQHNIHVDVLRGRNIFYPRVLSKIFEVVLRYIYYPLFIVFSPASVIHITDHAYSFLELITRVTGKKCIISLHSRPEDILSDRMWKKLNHQVYFPRLTKLLFTFSMRQLPKADHIICISPSIYTSLLRSGVSKKKLHMIPPPISDVYFRRLTKREQRLVRDKVMAKRNRFFILHVGRNDPADKNIEHVIRCVSTLHNRDFPVRFIKVGEPFTADQNRLITNLNIREFISHLGILSQSELRLVYRYCDVLLFPSYFEGCPAPPFEALASGLPVILSDIPAHKDFFKRYALFTDPDDYRTSAALIQRLHHFPDLTRERLRLGRIAALNMRWKTMSEKLLTVYSDSNSETSRP